MTQKKRVEKHQEKLIAAWQKVVRQKRADLMTRSNHQNSPQSTYKHDEETRERPAKKQELYSSTFAGDVSLVENFEGAGDELMHVDEQVDVLEGLASRTPSRIGR